MKSISLFLLFVLLLNFSSCALLINGSKQLVTIKTIDSGAEIYVDGQLKGTEAVQVNLVRRFNHTIEAKKAGCETKKVELKSRFKPIWLAPTIVFGIFTLGLYIIPDAATASWKGFDKNRVTIMLDCNEEDKK